MAWNCVVIYEYKKNIWFLRGLSTSFFSAGEKGEANNKDSGRGDDFMHGAIVRGATNIGLNHKKILGFRHQKEKQKPFDLKKKIETQKVTKDRWGTWIIVLHSSGCLSGLAESGWADSYLSICFVVFRGSLVLWGWNQKKEAFQASFFLLGVKC